MNALLAQTVDLVHAAAMIAWGIGLPLLVWHRYPRVSRAYMWFAVTFVVLSVVSNQVLGECFLTTLARNFWLLAGDHRDGVPFTVLFANTVAGIRPTTREAVFVWEIAVFATSLGTLFYWRKTRRTSRRRATPGRTRAMLERVGRPRFPGGTPSSAAS